MPIFLIDTDILIDVSKNIKPAVDWFKQAFKDNLELAVCPINITEFYSGLPPEKLPTWDNFFEPLDCWVITRNISRQAGIWRYEFAKKGLTISTPDSLIAATAHSHHATILTKNIQDYPMTDIKLLNPLN